MIRSHRTLLLASTALASSARAGVPDVFATGWRAIAPRVASPRPASAATLSYPLPQDRGASESNFDASAPPSRALPSPFSSPPFPFGDWLGPVIGAPDTVAPFPLQRRLEGSRAARGRTRYYGWLNGSYNASTSRSSNAPASYDITPNRALLNQFVLRAERNPGTTQTERMDYGFRASALYGTDYRYTIADGFLSNQLIKDNNIAGFDAPELYGLLYFPKVAEGMVLKVGRYISPPDIEAQLAPDNFMASHSLMFTVDPYTFMGAIASVRLSRTTTIAAGLHGGNDKAIWSRAAQLNGQLLVRYVTPDNDDSFWFGLNAIGGGKYKYGRDDIQMAVGTWGHRFNPRFFTMTEGYYLWSRDAALGGSAIFGPPTSFAGGGGAGPIKPGISTAVGVVNNLQFQLSPTAYLTFRNDYLRDSDGWRTGFKTAYSSHTLGVSAQVAPLVTIRPEIRYERAYDAPAYDNGTRRDQTKFLVDVIVRF